MLALISQKLFNIKHIVCHLLSLNQSLVRNRRNQISSVRNWGKQWVIEMYLFFPSSFLQPQFWEKLEHPFRSICWRRGLALAQKHFSTSAGWKEFWDSPSATFKLLKYRAGLYCEMVQMGSKRVPLLWSHIAKAPFQKKTLLSATCIRAF